MTEDLDAVPAYRLPVEKQLDHYFQGISRPLCTSSPGRPIVSLLSPMWHRKCYLGSVLSRPVRPLHYLLFHCKYRLFAPRPFADMREFLEVAEQGWTPRDPRHDPTVSKGTSTAWCRVSCCRPIQRRMKTIKPSWPIQRARRRSMVPNNSFSVNSRVWRIGSVQRLTLPRSFPRRTRTCRAASFVGSRTACCASWWDELSAR